MKATRNNLSREEAGDLRINWDEDDETSVAAAKDTFKEQKARGLVAYRVDKKGKATAEVMRDFDPAAVGVRLPTSTQRAGECPRQSAMSRHRPGGTREIGEHDADVICDRQYR